MRLTWVPILRLPISGGASPLCLSVETVVALFLGIGWGSYLFHVGAVMDGDGPSYLQSAFGLTHVGFSAIGVHWPPLFPILIALAGLVAPTPDAAATWIVALSQGAVLLLFVAIVRRYNVHPLVTSVCLAYIATSHTYVTNFRVLHSEAPFAALLLLHLLSMQRFLAHPDSKRWLAVAGGSVALAAVTRYTGYPFLGLFLAYVGYRWLAHRKERPFLFVLAMLIVAPSALYMLRTWLLTNTLLDDHGTALASLSEHIQGVPALLSAVIPLAALVLAIGTLLIAIVVGWLSRKGWQALFADPLRVFQGYLLCCLLGYLAFLVAAATHSAMPPLANFDRMIAPLLPALLIVVAAAPRILAGSLTPKWAIVPALVSVILGLALVSNTVKHWPYFLEKAMVAYGQPRTHMDYGFRVSSTRQGIAAYLWEAVKLDQGRGGARGIVVVGVLDIGMNRRHNEYAQGLLFRRDILDPARIEGYSNVRVGARGGFGVGSQFNLHYRNGNEAGTLRYRSLTHGCCSNWPGLLSDLQRIVEGEDAPEVRFFIDDTTYNALGRPPPRHTSARGAGLLLQDDTWIPPYRFMRWVRTAEG